MVVYSTNNSVLKKLKKKPLRALRSLKKVACKAGRVLRMKKSKGDSAHVGTEVLEARLSQMIHASNSDLLNMEQSMFGARLLTPKAQRLFLGL